MIGNWKEGRQGKERRKEEGMNHSFLLQNIFFIISISSIICNIGYL
jgi:hypothetical protein